MPEQLEILENLKKKRSALKGQLTRFQTYLNTIDQANIDFVQLETRLIKSEIWLEEFNNIQLEIESLDTETTQTGHYSERDKFEQNYYSIISKAKNILVKNTGTVSEISRSDEPNLNQNQFSTQNQIKLPQLDLPTFDGTLDKWLFYRDTFNSIIHSNTIINKIQKFHYLRLSLKGDAAEVISSLEVSTENYEIAWALLLERYENKTLLINNHVKALFNLTVITKENYTALRTMLDTISKHLRALEVLGQPVSHWDTLLIYLVASKLDPATRRDWESKNNTGDSPTFETLLQFLKQKCRLLETLNLNTSESQHQFQYRQKIKTHLSTDTYSCFLCKNNHLLYSCKQFLDLTARDRLSEVKRLGLCVNCLRKNHATKDCKASTCRTCNKRHHTLLHFLSDNTSTKADPENKVIQSENHSISNHSSSNNRSYTLLSTAIIQTFDKFGKLHDCRALLDSGSMSSFITEQFCDKLQLAKKNASFTISGIDQKQTTVNKSINIKIQSKFNRFQTPVTCLILPKITEKLPCFSFDKTSLDIPTNIALADQHFDKPAQIDILLGADVFWNLLKVGQIKLGRNKPTLQKTHFGWVVTGQILPPVYSNLNNKRCNFVTNEVLSKQIEKFWELEQVDNTKTLSPEEVTCEAHFIDNFKREQNGRFVVSIPFKESPELLGTSKEQAQRRFYNLERKLQQNPTFKQEYSDFLEEYESLNHMTKIDEDSSSDGYYMPHHGVIREDKITTKLRVVFDASAPTSTGISLNQLQMNGPVLQDDLFSILLRFRKHSYVVSADISKMYRQVMVTPEHRKYQKILWRSEPTNQLSTYALNTVTYGTTAASYLAIRCLNQLASESNYPIISDIIKSDFYVDDLLSGADNKQEASWLCQEISAVLMKGCFELRKWRSNDTSVIQSVCKDETYSSLMDFGSNIAVKTLGLVWSSESDVLKFNIKPNLENSKITKRIILSETAQIFDPLGLLSICTVSAKIIIQRLWQLHISWDESVPSDIHTAWLSFRGQLKYLNEINIPRHIICQNTHNIQLHCFSDSSTVSFGACCYIRSTDTSGNIQVNLLCSKSRVAPLKTTTIPRLELSAALLLAQLSEKVRSSMKINFSAVFHWTDSTIVLSWIRSTSNVWKIFISNRVSQIQALTETESWNYVNTKHNPADLITRGLEPKYLKSSALWWKGPEWLSKPEIEWPKPNFKLFENETFPREISSELKKSQIHTYLAIQSLDLVNKYSSFVKLQRVTAYILRFKVNCQTRKQDRLIGPLTPQELESATLALIYLVQHESFAEEIKGLERSGSVSKKSKILALNPFYDKEIIRVGGRLKHSQFEFSKKHPALLPPNHHLSVLLAENEHKRLLHAGPQTVLASLREKFWIVSGRNLIKKITRRCTRCLRFNPSDIKYIMSDLPKERITPARAFINSGVDYCGPFTIRDRLTRNYKPIKAYICLFVCLATKAIHLELVSDLSTNAFLAAFRRFTARRGKCVNLYSDNATNFTGADSVLRKFVDQHKHSFQTELSMEGIHWHFIPPRAPHFGGLWEAGVKSCKHHIKRVLGNAILSFEEFATVLAQIEACLNSRPLHPLSTDPNDPNALTPSHFLIGENITAVPDSNYLEVNENRLSRFQRLQKLLQHFWQRWSQEYLAELQTRTKWKQRHNELLQPGILVLIKEENAPPLKWLLGRIIEVHKGEDGVVRVVTLKTAHGLFKRPASKLCVIPNNP